MRIENQGPEELAELLRQAREGVRSDRPCLALSVREIPVPTIPAIAEADWTLPPARRQVIVLEMQNAALQHQKHKLLPEGPEPLMEETTAQPSYLKQLLMIQQENGQIRGETSRMRQKLERTKTISSESAVKQRGTHDWSKTLRGLQEELAHCRERQRKIRENYEERVMGLQGQLQQAKQCMPGVDQTLNHTFNPHLQDQRQLSAVMEEIALMERRISEATARRDDLKFQWGEAQQNAGGLSLPMSTNSLPMDVDVEQLQAQTQENEVILEQLRQELAQLHDREQGSEQQQELRISVAQLYEELDELQRVREDERVRSESEVRELKADRDRIKDRLDDGTAELQRLRSQSDALRAVRVQAEGDFGPSITELNQLKAENSQRAEELKRLRECEEARKQTIAELEREQEALVEKMTLKAAQSVSLGEGNQPDQYAKTLETKSSELSQMLERTQRSCEEKQKEVAQLKQSALDAQVQTESLRSSYDALQQSADGQVSRTVPGTSPQLPVYSCTSSIVSVSTGRSLN
jgi:chromosome segregation ATPase